MSRGIKHIYDPIFRQNYYYVMAPKHKNFLNIVDKKLGVKIDLKSGTNGRTVETKDGDIIIWTKELKPGIVAHEVNHAIYFSLGTRGIVLNDSTDEIFCYLAEFLTNEIFGFTKNGR